SWRCSMRVAVQIVIVAGVFIASIPAAQAWEISLHSPPGEPDPLAPAVNAAYNAEYLKSQTFLQGWLKGHPADYRAWNYLAEAVLDEEMLREGMFTGGAYLNRGTAFQRRNEPLPGGFTAKLNGFLDRAASLEEARLKTNSRDEDAVFWQGVTYRTRAEFDFILLRSYLAALSQGKKAWEVNRELLKLDPQCADALFVLGLAQYAAGKLPWYLRIVASLAGIHGNVSQGIAELRASENGRYTRVDAKIVLVAVYEREKMYPQALGLLQELQGKFPDNYLLVLEAGRLYEKRRDWNAAEKTYDAAVKRFVRGKPEVAHLPVATVLYRDGRAHERVGDLRGAVALYHQAATAKPPRESLDVYRAAMAAAALDRKFNDIARAKQEYQQVAEAVPDTALGKAARHALGRLH
ncbi:MAG: tetratricopeptide repeat protein, partial [Terriglobia bacterium]